MSIEVMLLERQLIQLLREFEDEEITEKGFVQRKLRIVKEMEDKLKQEFDEGINNIIL